MYTASYSGMDVSQTDLAFLGILLAEEKYTNNYEVRGIFEGKFEYAQYQNYVDCPDVKVNCACS